MDQLDEQISKDINRIVGNGDDDPVSTPIMTAEVIAGSYDDEQKTISVRLSVDDADAQTDGVLTNVYVQQADGLTVIPADGSKVWVAELDGPGTWGIIKTSQIVKMRCAIGELVFEMSAGKIQMLNGGVSFKTLVDGLFDAIKAITVSTGTGPSSVPINNATFDTLKGQFDNLFY